MSDGKRTGTLITFLADVAGGSPAAIAGARNITFSASGDEIDVTTKDTTQLKDYLAGRTDVSLQGEHITLFDNSTGAWNASQKKLVTAITTGGSLDFQVAFSGTTALSGTGFVTAFELSGEDNAASVTTFTLRITSLTVA